MLFEFLEILDFIEDEVRRECANNNNCNRCKFTNCSGCDDDYLFAKIREIAEIAFNENCI